MTDLLRIGQNWLTGKLKTHASQSVTYKRDSAETELQATIGRSTYQQDDGEGIITRSQVRDFLIDTSDLVSSSIGSLPAFSSRSLNHFQPLRLMFLNYGPTRPKRENWMLSTRVSVITRSGCSRNMGSNPSDTGFPPTKKNPKTH